MKTLVLLHAFPLDHRMWNEVAGEIAKTGWQVFTPDFRGCGEADDWSGQIPTLKALAEDVLELMDNFGIENFVVGGCSLGGYVTMELMRWTPQRIAGAIFIGTKATADNSEQFANRLRVASQVEEAGTTEAFWRAMLPNALGKTTHETQPRIVEFTRSLMADSRVNGVANLQRAMSERVDQHKIIAGYGGPILSIRGDEDTVASSQDHEMIMDVAKNGYHVEVKECGHLAPIEKPHETAKAIIAFLNKVSAPSC